MLSALFCRAQPDRPRQALFTSTSIETDFSGDWLMFPREVRITGISAFFILWSEPGENACLARFPHIFL
jgi:hypothetical protein